MASNEIIVCFNLSLSNDNSFVLDSHKASSRSISLFSLSSVLLRAEEDDDEADGDDVDEHVMSMLLVFISKRDDFGSLVFRL